MAQQLPNRTSKWCAAICSYGTVHRGIYKHRPVIAGCAFKF